jgi:hypothetical protein
MERLRHHEAIPEAADLLAVDVFDQQRALPFKASNPSQA